MSQTGTEEEMASAEAAEEGPGSAGREDPAFEADDNEMGSDAAAAVEETETGDDAFEREPVDVEEAE